MKFRVNAGQRIPQFRHEPGEAPQRVWLQEGDVTEGPAWWTEEFRGRMTPLDDDGNPLGGAALEAASRDLLTARAHEKVGILKQMIERNPGIAEALKPELAKAEKEAEEAQAAFLQKRADREKFKERVTGGPQVRKVAKADESQPGPAAVEVRQQ